jgi:hypothetical protein
MIEKDIIFPVDNSEDINPKTEEEINILKSKEKSLKMRLLAMVLGSLLVIFITLLLSIFI